MGSRGGCDLGLVNPAIWISAVPHIKQRRAASEVFSDLDAHTIRRDVGSGRDLNRANRRAGIGLGYGVGNYYTWSIKWILRHDSLLYTFEL
jgi:hypothetical protein